MDRKRCANDTLRPWVRKHRVLSKFKENSIQNHTQKKDLIESKKIICLNNFL